MAGVSTGTGVSYGNVSADLIHFSVNPNAVSGAGLSIFTPISPPDGGSFSMSFSSSFSGGV